MTYITSIKGVQLRQHGCTAYIMCQSHLHTVIRKLKASRFATNRVKDGKLPCACGRCNKNIEVNTVVIGKRTSNVTKVYLVECAARLNIVNISDSALAELHKQEAMMRGVSA